MTDELRRKLEQLRAEMDTFDRQLADVTRTAAELAHHQRSLRSALMAAMNEMDRIDPDGAPAPAALDPSAPAVEPPTRAPELTTAEKMELAHHRRRR